MGQLLRIDFGAGKLVPVDDVTNRPAAADGARYAPRYCDPANERRGAKYDERLSTKEIAARIREQIKADLKAGVLLKGTKVSVRYESFSGGSAIRVSVTAYAGKIFDRETLRWEREHPHECPPRGMPRYTAEAKALLDKISSYAKAYHRDNSDTMVDYFDVNFYDGDARFDWQLERADERAALAESLASVLPLPE